MCDVPTKLFIATLWMAILMMANGHPLNTPESGINQLIPQCELYRDLITCSKQRECLFMSGVCAYNVPVPVNGQGAFALLGDSFYCGSPVNKEKDEKLNVSLESHNIYHVCIRSDGDSQRDCGKLIRCSQPSLGFRMTHFDIKSIDTDDQTVLEPRRGLQDDAAESVVRTGYFDMVSTQVIIAVVGFVILAIIGFIVFYIMRKVIRKRKQGVRSQKEKERYLKFQEEKHEVRIVELIADMKNGTFEELKTKYQEDHCVICLCKYKPSCKMCVTNECFHSFHSQCLKEWYQKCDKNCPLRCPHCNTINRRVVKANSRKSNQSHFESSEYLDVVPYSLPLGPRIAIRNNFMGPNRSERSADYMM